MSRTKRRRFFLDPALCLLAGSHGKIIKLTVWVYVETLGKTRLFDDLQQLAHPSIRTNIATTQSSLVQIQLNKLSGIAVETTYVQTIGD